MIRIFILILSFWFFPYFSFAEPGRTDLPVVSKVDLNRYIGTWYEIARFPNSFQKDCAASVSATYTLRKDGKIQVLNQCVKSSGKQKSSKGVAKIVDRKTNAKLKVTFFWPFYGDYWILDLGSNYEYAVVGEPERKYLWILSRDPEIPDSLYDRILMKIQELGYDKSRLIRTPANLST